MTCKGLDSILPSSVTLLLILGKYVCSGSTDTINAENPSFSKDSIAEYYGIEKEKKPHRAQNGVDHLLLCYETIIGFPYKEKD